MNTDEHRFSVKPEELGDELNRLSERIIGCAYVVANTLSTTSY